MTYFRRLFLGLAITFLFSSRVFSEIPTITDEFQPTWKLPESGLPFEVYKNQVFSTIQNSAGTSFKAKVDTGSPFTLIDRSLLDFFEHYETDQIQEIGGINGFATSIDTSMKKGDFHVVHLKNIYVGGVRVGDLQACVLDYHSENYDEGDLLLGMNVFQDQIIALQFSKGRIVSGNMEDRSAIWMSLIWKDLSIPMVAARNWNTVFPLVIDTGCQLSMRGFLLRDEEPKRAYAGNLTGIFVDIETNSVKMINKMQGIIHPNPGKVSLVGVKYLQEDDWLIDFPGKRVGPVTARLVDE